MTQEDLAEKMHTNCESHPFASSASFAVIRIKEKVNRKGREGREGKMPSYAFFAVKNPFISERIK